MRRNWLVRGLKFALFALLFLAVFTYVVMADSTVAVRPLQIGEESGALTVVAGGIAEGDTVVTSNQYRLQPGAQIRTNTATAKSRGAAPVKEPLVVMDGASR